MAILAIGNKIMAKKLVNKSLKITFRLSDDGAASLESDTYILKLRLYVAIKVDILTLVHVVLLSKLSIPALKSLDIASNL